jgi:hypothetical protein
MFQNAEKDKQHQMDSIQDDIQLLKMEHENNLDYISSYFLLSLTKIENNFLNKLIQLDEEL